MLLELDYFSNYYNRPEPGGPTNFFSWDEFKSAVRNAAIETALAAQQRALREQRQAVVAGLDPAKLAEQAREQDVKTAEARLKTQQALEPGMAALRAEGTEALRRALASSGETASEVERAAVEAALQDQTRDLRQQLINAAVSELNLGGRLSSDAQAELVRAGLEQAGLVTGRSSGQGFSGNITRQLLGTASTALQAERQTRAANLAAAAGQLHQSRVSLLAQLFPALRASQQQQAALGTGAVSVASSELPQAGLTGADFINLALSRLGALNQLTASAGKNIAEAAKASGEANIGGIETRFGKLVPAEKVGSATSFTQELLSKFSW